MSIESSAGSTSISPPQRSATRGFISSGIALLGVLYSLAVVLPIAFYRPLRSGRDPNWWIALDYAYEHGLIFGRDIVFTYGPLGFLHARLAYPDTALVLAVWDLCSYGLFGYALAIVFARLTSLWERLGVMAICTIVGLTQQPLDSSILYFFLSLFFNASFVSEHRIRHGVLSVVCASIALFLKVSFGILSFALLIPSLALCLTKPHPRQNALVVCALGGAWLCTMILALPVDLLPYLSYSLEFISQFPEAMSSTPAENQKYLVSACLLLASFAIYTLAGIVFARKFSAAIIALLIADCFLFALFKQGFVRADNHIYEFLQFMPLTFLLCYPFFDSISRRCFLPCVLAGFAVFYVHHDALPELSTPRHRLATIGNYSRTFATPAPQGHIPTGHTPVQPLSPHLVSMIGSATVDVVTFQSYLLIQSKLHYQPRPVIHSYAAYTGRLDALNAEFYESSHAPEYVLYSHVRIDNRYPFFDESQTRIAMRRWYEPIDDSDGFLVLQRQSTPEELSFRTLNATTLGFDEKITVPESEHAVYLFAEVRYSLRGSLVKFLYRPPLCTLTLHYADGRTYPARAIPEQLAHGVLINKAVQSRMDVAAVMRGELGSLETIESISFSCDWPWGLARNSGAVLNVEFRELAPQ